MIFHLPNLSSMGKLLQLMNQNQAAIIIHAWAPAAMYYYRVIGTYINGRVEQQVIVVQLLGEMNI